MEFIHQTNRVKLPKLIDVEKTHGFEQHCIRGEEAVSILPFHSDVKGYILYHHENADGSGPLGKKAGEIPFGAELIHLADQVDVHFDLSNRKNQYEEILKFVTDASEKKFSKQCVEIFFGAFTPARYEEFLECDHISFLAGLLHLEKLEEITFTPTQIHAMAEMFERIVDFKSPFTCRHSLGIAEKAYQMGKFYKQDEEFCEKLFMAGAIHDVGKLMIREDVLEKEGKLTDNEYNHIQTHVSEGSRILKEVHEMDDEIRWAMNHHERLDGSGYPMGKKGTELDFYDRLFEALDMYQALTEERPYKDGFSHQKTMDILQQAVSNGKLDKTVVADIDKVFG